MPEYVLIPDQIGELASDGSITKHPTLDIQGNEYARVNATRKPISKTRFVVIPAGKDSEDNVYTVLSDKPAPKAKE